MILNTILFTSENSGSINRCCIIVGFRFLYVLGEQWALPWQAISTVDSPPSPDGMEGVNTQQRGKAMIIDSAWPFVKRVVDIPCHLSRLSSSFKHFFSFFFKLEFSQNQTLDYFYDWVAIRNNNVSWLVWMKHCSFFRRLFQQVNWSNLILCWFEISQSWRNKQPDYSVSYLLTFPSLIFLFVCLWRFDSFWMQSGLYGYSIKQTPQQVPVAIKRLNFLVPN